MSFCFNTFVMTQYNANEYFSYFKETLSRAECFFTSFH